MQYDNATLLFPDGIATGINLDSGFFSKAARHIYTFREAAFRRKKNIKDHIYFSVISDDIIRSHCPTYIDPPYGSRTRISTCVSIGLTDPHMYFAYCKTEFNLSRRRLETFAARLDTAQEHAEKEHQPHGKGDAEVQGRQGQRETGEQPQLGIMKHRRTPAVIGLGGKSCSGISGHEGTSFPWTASHWAGAD